MTPTQTTLLFRSLASILRNQGTVLGVLAVDHPALPALEDLAKIALEMADNLGTVAINAASPADPFIDPTKEDLFRTHTCYRCHDGEQPARCPNACANPRMCDTLRARSN